ncbi:MAG TPA: hypothetical protein PLJ11_08855 [Methanomassiliicoccales archaeon]|nr:hypothetical protein [Euryarchaeota archaeon]HOO04815.1 hypothetical protein [Methanomassiliicoccales archaeon]HRR66773.1 hypothetical protein [Methanomassiliicoccales archaeon]HRU11157.1 hypothetical protein [Methanomassiliicoccales archaeon]
MAYRPNRNKSRARKPNNYRNRDAPSTRVGMLNQRRVGEFKYDVRELFVENKLDPDQASTFLASVIAKASRQSIKDAKDYVREQQATGAISKEIMDGLVYYLDRYTKYQSQQTGD